MELVDAPDSKSGSARSVGSTPTTRTRIESGPRMSRGAVGGGRCRRRRSGGLCGPASRGVRRTAHAAGQPRRPSARWRVGQGGRGQHASRSHGPHASAQGVSAPARRLRAGACGGGRSRAGADALGQAPGCDRDRDRRVRREDAGGGSGGRGSPAAAYGCGLARGGEALVRRAGVHAAYDGIGGETLARSLACVRPFGVVASLGQAGGPIPSIDVGQLGPVRCISLSRPSVVAYTNDPALYGPAAADLFAALLQGVGSGGSAEYALRDAARAHGDLEAGGRSGA